MNIETQAILRKQKVGLWNIEIREGQPTRLIVDDVMAELMGLTEELSPEEVYLAWSVGTNEESAKIMNDATTKMIAGEYAEAQYSWKHPDGSMRLVRCGGSRDFSCSDHIKLVGSHRDVTELIHFDMAQAVRDRNIINRYLESSSFAITIDLLKDAYITLKPDSDNNSMEDEGCYTDLMHRFVNSFVAAPFVRDMMEVASSASLRQKLEANDHVQVKFRRKTGNIYRWYRFDARKLTASEAFVTFRDIDKREQENLFWEAISTQIICGFIIDIKTQLVAVTRRSEIYTDYMEYKHTTLDRVVEIAGSIMDDGYLDDWKEFCKIEKLSAISRESRRAEFSFTTHKTGKMMWVRASLYPIHTQEGGATIALSFTQYSKEAMEKLKRDEEYRKALEQIRFAQEANRLKTTFVQNISHDIRTPLNAIVGFSQLLSLQDGYLSEEEKSRYADYITDSADLLTIIINDVLSMSDIERGMLNINKVPASCNEICRKSVNCSSMRTPAGVKMYYTSEADDSFMISTDAMRVQQILVNYLSNACKHTTEGEILVHCSVTENPGKVTFSVADTGEGVAPEIAEDIFERFKTFDASMDGHGMGLNICRDLAQRLGGQVALDRNYKNGARFTLVLPTE